MSNQDTEKLITGFNTRLIGIINKLLKCSKGDISANLDRLQKRIIGIKLLYSREILIQKIGPELFKFHKEIIDRDEDFFFKPRDYKKELNGKLENKDSSFVDLIPIVIDIYQSMDSDELDDIYEDIRFMLTTYISYEIKSRK